MEENIFAVHLVIYTLPPAFCTCRIRIENALKTQAIRTVFSTRILYNQSPLVTDNVLNYSIAHLSVHPFKSHMRITHWKCARNANLQYKYASVSVYISKNTKYTCYKKRARLWSTTNI